MTRLQTLVADPPWLYGDALPKTANGRARGAKGVYKNVMTLKEIEGFLETSPTGNPHSRQRISDGIADDAILWLWTTNSMLIDGSAPGVCERWGFEPKQLVTWVKGRLSNADPLVPKLVLRVGMGRYTRGATEHMILATKGRATRLVKSRSVPNVFVAPPGEHSAKPEESYRLIECVSPGPYLELFARRQRPGWTCIGDEL